MFELNPYPKSKQLGKSQKDNDTPKFKEKRPKKKKKKCEVFKGRTIPPAKIRGKISKTEYEKAIEEFGSTCAFCNNPYIEMHHIRFRSQQGRGQYRNLIPLCTEHHLEVHKNHSLAEKIKRDRIEKYGEWYWSDRFDIFKAGFIENTTDTAFFWFMEEEEKNADRLRSVVSLAEASDQRRDESR
jgi:5-methylcytosine-specific restriction endonuclease McrA